MVKKIQKTSSDDSKKSAAALSGTVKESASQIWTSWTGRERSCG